MNDSFIAYIQQLELIAFFSGFPLVYAIVQVLAGSFQNKNSLVNRFASSLTYAYSLIGLLFLGFQLKKLYPNYSISGINAHIQHPYLVIWALTAMLFCIPMLAKRGRLALLHSLIFLFPIILDLFKGNASGANFLQNDMKVYGSSLILNVAAIIVIVAISYLLSFLKKQLRSD